MVDAMGTTRYTFYGAGRLLTEDGPWASDTVTSGYNAIGQLTNALGSGGQSTENLGWAYDPAWNLANLRSGSTPSAFLVNGKNELLTNSPNVFTHDDNPDLRYGAGGSRIKKVTSGTKANFYVYDAENQLLSACTGSNYTAIVSRWRVEFTYDGRGRLRIL
jgi:hypothetical protein